MNLQILQFRIIKIYLILLHITYNLEKVFLNLYLLSSIKVIIIINRFILK